MNDDNVNGETLDLKRVRLTVAQFVALLLLLIGAITGATVTTVTTQATAAAVVEMRTDLKEALSEIRETRETNIDQNGTLKEHDSRLNALERGQRYRGRDSARGGE